MSSLGEGGAETIYPIIHPPQVAIVGFGSVVTRPWVVGGAVAPASVMTATLSADHRVSDGHRGSQFLLANRSATARTGEAMSVPSEETLRATILDSLLSVAPDIDAAALDPRLEFREQFDFDSMDYLSLATALHARLGVDVPEVDYPKLGSLDGCVRYVADVLSSEEFAMTLVAHDLFIPIEGAQLRATLTLPDRAEAVILFAHGSGSGRLSPRNARVAHALHERGLGTLLFDLLTSEEAREDEALRSYRFDIELLAERLATATSWLKRQRLAPRTFAYFGASTGAAAALLAAARAPADIAAVASRGGRPDLAGHALASVEAPTLLIVGGARPRRARAQRACARATALRQGAGRRARRDAPVRGTRHARRGRTTRRGLVRPALHGPRG